MGSVFMLIGMILGVLAMLWLESIDITGNAIKGFIG
jgi:ABC-type lipoprotein release transport system permease subunit